MLESSNAVGGDSTLTFKLKQSLPIQEENVSMGLVWKHGMAKAQTTVIMFEGMQYENQTESILYV